MSILVIGSTGDSAGHTLLTWAVLKRLRERGLKIGFIKPFGTCPLQMEGGWTDHDALLFKEALGLEEPLSEICPYPVADAEGGQAETLDPIENLKRSIQRLSEGKDVLVIMGAKHIFFDDPTRPLQDVSLIPLLDADFILIHRYRKLSKSIYSILSVCSLLRESIRGIVLNRVPPEELGALKEKLMGSLLKKGIPVAAALPEDPPLSYRSIREVAELFGGSVLCGEGGLEQPIASLTVGSHDLSSDLMLFKRSYNKIVLLSQPEGSQGEAVQRKIAGILITGGRHPAPQMIESARKAGIPLVLVREDTFAVLERLEQSPSVLSSKDEMKLHRFSDMLDGENALDSMIGRLRLQQRQKNR